MFSGKNIILTGSAGGIGKKTLELLAENGANVWACARKATDEFEHYINELKSRFNVQITPIYFDFREEQQIKNAIKQIYSEKKTIDGLVNNAGITYNALFQMTGVEKMKEVFEINFFSQIIFTQYVIKLMMRQKSGSIVNIVSSAALDGNSGRSIYGASKAALLCVTKSLSEEVASYNIRVNAIAPGITNTNMVELSMTEQVIKETINNTKLKRMGEPDEIASSILFLLSDLSSYMTGQVLRVDGGLG
ncbi:SDR family NAD(P)-dependent oxidoreductase [Lysinibacillus sp. OTC-L20]|uniref:SDR family NAD(P)-dependent oxidoreductase n=1 Tax=Lysinibacillus sp. OTC-L20 TaxID=3342791 RepID=UPI0035BAC376